MSVAHIDLDHASAEVLASSRAHWRIAGLLSGIGIFTLAAVPGAFAVLLLVRPDLLLTR